MKSITETLETLFSEASKKAFPNLENTLTEITPSTNPKFGHYQYNSAMKLSKALKQPPRIIAEAIIPHVDRSLIANLEIAGPGFINITLSTDFLNDYTNRMLHDDNLGANTSESHQKVIVEFSSPNVAKELHVGHLRSTIIGDSIARIFEFLGYDVLRLNHIGDWGTQFGMLIAYIKKVAPEMLEGSKEVDLPQLMQWYKESKNTFDHDSEFKKQSQLEVVALQGGDQGSKKAWEVMCDISRKAYQEIYDLLDVKIVERGESYYNEELPKIVAELEEKGIVEVSHGAKCIFLDGFINRDGDPLPLMIQKSDGGYNYDTTDMAAIKQRIVEEKADRIIYITDAGQAQHFYMVFKAAEKAGYYNPEKIRIDHVPFGLVLGSDGKKFKTRSGDTEKLIDLLNAAIEKARQIMDDRSPDIEKEERDHIAKELGIGAVKYADLSTNRTGDYMFSYDKMLRFEGNTAAFLMYSYVRIAGIKRKTGTSIDEIKGSISLEHPSEIDLGLHLCRFGEALETVLEDLLPSRLSDYLYQLAQKFNAFFRDCRVEGSDQQEERLLLCELTARTLQCGLSLLGVNTVDRM